MSKFEGEPKDVEQNSGAKELPDYLQKMKSDLEKIEAQRVPDWVKKEKEKNIERLRKEIKAEEEILELRERINSERRSDIEERFGPEMLREAEQTAQKMGQDIEKHLVKAKNKAEAQKILEMWKKFQWAVDILLEQNVSKPITEEEALKKAIHAFRPRDIEE